jgi:hypothetical protein
MCVQLGWLRVRWWAGPSSILLSTRWPGEPSPPPPPLLLQQQSHTQASATLPLHPRYESNAIKSNCTVKKVIVFPVPSRDVLTKLSLARNNLIIPESLASDIPAGDGKSDNPFYSVH